MSDLPLCLDLFCGTGSATAPIREHGCMRVVGFDLSPKAKGRDVTADVRRLPLAEGVRPRFVWASPPCQLFSTAAAAWHFDRDERAAVGMGTIRLALDWARRADYYAVENVRGSLRFIIPEFGEPALRGHAYYVWTNLPLGILKASNRLGKGIRIPPKSKPPTPGHPRFYTHHYRTKRTIEAARIPRPLAEAVHEAVCPEAPA